MAIKSHPSLLALTAIAALGCDRTDSDTMRLSPAVATPTPGQTSGEQAAMAQQPGAPPGEVAPTVAARQNQPSVHTNLSRNFQGEMVAEITRPGQTTPGVFRYASHSDKFRMQLQGMPTNFDILGVDENLHVLNHENDSYRSLSIPDVEGKAEHRDVDSKATGEIRTHQGITCNERVIEAEPYRIEACVGGLPGDFELGVFERATGVKVPAWVAALVDEGYIPITATAYGPDNKEAFKLEVTRYSPDPVAAQLFELPTNYRAVSQ